MEQQPFAGKLKISIDLRILVALLVLIIAGMLAVWKPWAAPTGNDRTITVSGEAKISASPDEYTFQPTYEFKDANKDAGLAALTKKSDELVAKLKELGVPDDKIKVSSDGNDYRTYYFESTSREFTYTLRPTITIDNRELAQKVQDYLVGTSPTGQISPQAGFSEAKKKELEGNARDTATKDARAKADQSAKNLGFKVSKVKSIEDGTNFGGIMPYMASDKAAASPEAKPASLGLQPGQNDLTYTVTVVYYIR
jgi:uncharacterized protein YggE